MIYKKKMNIYYRVIIIIINKMKLIPKQISKSKNSLEKINKILKEKNHISLTLRIAICLKCIFKLAPDGKILQLNYLEEHLIKLKVDFIHFYIKEY